MPLHQPLHCLLPWWLLLMLHVLVLYFYCLWYLRLEPEHPKQHWNGLWCLPLKLMNQRLCYLKQSYLHIKLTYRWLYYLLLSY